MLVTAKVATWKDRVDWSLDRLSLSTVPAPALYKAGSSTYLYIWEYINRGNVTRK